MKHWMQEPRIWVTALWAMVVGTLVMFAMGFWNEIDRQASRETILLIPANEPDASERDQLLASLPSAPPGVSLRWISPQKIVSKMGRHYALDADSDLLPQESDWLPWVLEVSWKRLPEIKLLKPIVARARSDKDKWSNVMWPGERLNALLRLRQQILTLIVGLGVLASLLGGLALQTLPRPKALGFKRVIGSGLLAAGSVLVVWSLGYMTEAPLGADALGLGMAVAAGLASVLAPGLFRARHKSFHITIGEEDDERELSHRGG